MLNSSTLSGKCINEKRKNESEQICERTWVRVCCGAMCGCSTHFISEISAEYPSLSLPFASVFFVTRFPRRFNGLAPKYYWHFKNPLYTHCQMSMCNRDNKHAAIQTNYSTERSVRTVALDFHFY